MVETVDIFERAIGITEKEMNGGASMMQLMNARTITEVLGLMIQAQSHSDPDAHKLTLLIQYSIDYDSEGAPDQDAYDDQSGGVIDMNILLVALSRLAFWAGGRRSSACGVPVALIGHVRCGDLARCSI